MSDEQEAPESEINEEAFAALAESDEQGPVVMLNLLEFKPDGGFESYMKYAEAVAPLLEKVGGKIRYSGMGAELVIGSEDWDMVALVEYPSRKAFLEMIASEAYQAIMHYRDEALVRSVLHATNPLA